jgi:hypothetical protein
LGTSLFSFTPDNYFEKFKKASLVGIKNLKKRFEFHFSAKNKIVAEVFESCPLLEAL